MKVGSQRSSNCPGSTPFSWICSAAALIGLVLINNFAINANLHKSLSRNDSPSSVKRFGKSCTLSYNYLKLRGYRGKSNFTYLNTLESFMSLAWFNMGMDNPRRFSLVAALLDKYDRISTKSNLIAQQNVDRREVAWLHNGSSVPGSFHAFFHVLYMKTVALLKTYHCATESTRCNTF